MVKNGALAKAGTDRIATGEEAAAAGLSQAVALGEVAAKGDCQKFFHVGGEGGSPADACPDTPSQPLLDLGEDQPVEEGGSLHHPLLSPCEQGIASRFICLCLVCLR